jgi:hypothetical protein
VLREGYLAEGEESHVINYERRETNDETQGMRPEQGTLISRAQAMAALLELLTDQPVIVARLRRSPIGRRIFI